VPAVRRQLRLQIATALQEVLGDPGLVPFLLQNGLGMSPADAGRVVGLGENAVRQRLFRFRRRFKRVWQSKYPHNQCPFTVERG
jgi:DNA-directed RNA polymerase specialized sigma24 family protein